MSNYKSHTIECDQCGNTLTVTKESKRELLRRAKIRGWDIGRGNIADLCPFCVKLDEKAKREAVS